MKTLAAFDFKGKLGSVMLESIENYYKNYDEDGRLFRDKAHLPEYLTTIRYFDRLFTPSSRILDACAGTGRYSFYLAEKGHIITACDLVEHNVGIIKAKPEAEKLREISVCNVLDLSRFDENNFDVVLCMGAIYHLPTDEDKTQAIRECTRVCKPGGLVVLSYLNYFAVVAADVKKGLDDLDDILAAFEDNSNNLWKATTPAKMEGYAKDVGLEILHNIGADGISFVLADKVNAATDEAFDRWMEYIYKHCEEPSIIGYSMHGLLFGRKK
ncbi:MAG: methyltransferase domain-containing protein [Oscillospiraceae bacterium]|nr:methyltransferase domain-containing protein [Oscillospiraceae bacterium]